MACVLHTGKYLTLIHINEADKFQLRASRDDVQVNAKMKAELRHIVLLLDNAPTSP
jgi:hypothetical protein